MYLVKHSNSGDTDIVIYVSSYYRPKINRLNFYRFFINYCQINV